MQGVARGTTRGSRRLALGFTLRFFALVFLITGLARIDALLLERAVGTRLTTGSAALVAATLDTLGQEVRRHDNTLYYSGAAFRVIDECTGIEVIALFAAAVLAFPSPWRRRLAGLALGIGVLLLVNWLRMVSLVWIGASSKDALEVGHVYVWPTLILTIALALWLHWARIASDAPDPVG